MSICSAVLKTAEIGKQKVFIFETIIIRSGFHMLEAVCMFAIGTAIQQQQQKVYGIQVFVPFSQSVV